MADKLFAIPVWVCIVVMNPTHLWIQLAASSHVLIEAVSVLARTKSFYLKPTASSTVVTAGYKGKLKQAISMLGTALVLLPEAQLVGGALLVASLPLSFASLQDKLPTKQARPRAWVLLHPTETDPIAVLAGIARKRDQYDVYVCTTTSRETEFWLGMGDFVCGVLQRAPTTPFTQDELVELGGGEVWVESPVTTTSLISEAKPL